MIEPKELRLGNIFQFKVKGEIEYWDISSLSKYEVYFTQNEEYNHYINLDEDAAVPLTKELLLKCGFTIGGEGGVLNQDLLGISLPNDSAVNGILQDKNGNIVIVGSEFEYTEPKIEYLHQLQNFWFANTNEELPIKDLIQ